MAYPTSDHTVDTPYGRRGHNWSCNENSSGGIHTGDDFAVASNTPLYAAIAGTIRHRQYGSWAGDRQFAISPSAGQPFEAGEVFYAHGNERLADGTEVQVGDYVGKSGARGNVTGPHLHFEFHPNEKNSWYCGVHANPSAVYGTSGGGGGGDSGSEYPTPTSNKVYVSKLVQGQMASDSVWYLQRSLNQNGNPPEGASLPLTGNFLDQTAAAVKGCQQAHGFGDDPMGSVYVGPSQAAHLFDGWGLEIIYDTGNPSPPDTEEPPPSQGDKPPAPALMLPNAVWDPITNFPGLRPFTGSAKKVTLHTTETTVKPNWEAQQSGIPHLTVDLDSGQRWQHLPFDLAAYTLSGGDNSPNSASGVNIQIEIIGFTADCPHWDYVVYEELRQILEWLCENLGIPYDFPYPFEAPANRLLWENWASASGILGHLHAPYNNHSDPTGLRTDLLTGVNTPPDVEEPPLPTGDYVTLEEYEAGQQALDGMLADIRDAITAYLQEE
jgi:murein DD-endopeptidase MepM/ murein hydrolase activator NlpD